MPLTQDSSSDYVPSKKLESCQFILFSFFYFLSFSSATQVSCWPLSNLDWTEHGCWTRQSMSESQVWSLEASAEKCGQRWQRVKESKVVICSGTFRTGLCSSGKSESLKKYKTEKMSQLQITVSRMFSEQSGPPLLQWACFDSQLQNWVEKNEKK